MRSTSRAAVASIAPVSAATARGVNDRVSSRRSREWSGGSMFSIIRRTQARSAASRTCVAPSHEENVAGSRSTRSTSECRSTSQNPGPAGWPCMAGSSTRTTGVSARSRRSASNGGPSS